MNSGRVPKASDRAGGGDCRKHRRYKSVETGRLWFRGIPFECTFQNISEGGVEIETDLGPLEGSLVELEASTLGRVSAEIVYVSGSRIGLKFKTEIAVTPQRRFHPERPKRRQGPGLDQPERGQNRSEPT